MSNWRRWVWPGLATTLVLALLATAIESGDVERDLAARVTGQLVSAGQDWAVVAVSGRGVEIGGVAPSEEAQKLALEAATAVAGTGSISDRLSNLTSGLSAA